MKRFLIPIIFIACNSHASAIQKWTDENGQVHYGDRPPAKVDSQEIRVNRPPSNPGKPLPRLGNDQEDEAAEENPENQAPTTETPEEQAKQACEQARKDLRVIERSTRIRLKSADGKTRFMTKEEIDQRRQRSEQDIQQFCK